MRKRKMILCQIENLFLKIFKISQRFLLFGLFSSMWMSVLQGSWLYIWLTACCSGSLCAFPSNLANEVDTLINLCLCFLSILYSQEGGHLGELHQHTRFSLCAGSLQMAGSLFQFDSYLIYIGVFWLL